MALDDPRHHALCVTISTCGNYGLVGTRGGVIYKYNMQSGQTRGQYPSSSSGSSSGGKKVVGRRARHDPESVFTAYKAIAGYEPKVVSSSSMSSNNGSSSSSSSSSSSHSSSSSR